MLFTRFPKTRLEPLNEIRFFGSVHRCKTTKHFQSFFNRNAGLSVKIRRYDCFVFQQHLNKDIVGFYQFHDIGHIGTHGDFKHIFHLFHKIIQHMDILRIYFDQCIQAIYFWWLCPLIRRKSICIVYTYWDDACQNLFSLKDTYQYILFKCR